jgi:Fe-Mn family superoxide dismutase
MTHKMVELGYEYSAIEPVINKDIMEIHYSKHYAAYVSGLNKAIDDSGKFSNLSLLEIMKNIKDLPESERGPFKNNGGGACNHELFWSILTPGGSDQPSGDFLSDIEETFGSYNNMVSAVNDAGMKRFGSGWAWLVWDSGLKVCSTANQDSPLMGKEVSGCQGVPLIGIDVWEHAYYLQYMKRRPESLQKVWVALTWDKIEALYRAANS